METGFRTGGFNLANGYTTYQPEAIEAFTFNAKNWFFNGRLELNAEAFRWLYKNQQVAHLGVDLAGQNNFTQNVGRSTNQGFEFETRFLLTPTTVLNANVQYLDATYDQFSYQVPFCGAPPYVGCPVSLRPRASSPSTAPAVPSSPRPSTR